MEQKAARGHTGSNSDANLRKQVFLSFLTEISQGNTEGNLFKTGKSLVIMASHQGSRKILAFSLLARYFVTLTSRNSNLRVCVLATPGVCGALIYWRIARDRQRVSQSNVLKMIISKCIIITCKAEKKQIKYAIIFPLGSTSNIQILKIFHRNICMQHTIRHTFYIGLCILLSREQT
jgi:hypothetical protein